MAKHELNAAPVRLRIVDAHGHAVADSAVSLVSSTVPFPEITLLANRQGVIELRLPAGRFTFRAQAPDGRTGDLIITSPPPTSEAVIDIEVK